MNNKVFGAVLFATGAVIGSVATWFAVKTKYEKIAQEEIDSVKVEFDQLVKNRKKEMEIYHRIMDAKKNEESKEDEESDSDSEYYSEEDDSEYEQTMIDYSNLTRNYSSSGDEDDESNENDKEGVEGGEDEIPYINGPYVISPEEFNDRTDFCAQPLDYYADGVLADGWGVKLDIEETIGEESLNHFGEYDDDIVYVRNERTETDYEVTRDPRTYEERIGTNPYPNYFQ